MTQVKYTPKDKRYGLTVQGDLYSIDKGYRAYIVTDRDLKGMGHFIPYKKETNHEAR